MKINIDEKGHFIGVKQGDKVYSIKDWNAKIENEFKKINP